jgi:hypothetical protein
MPTTQQQQQQQQLQLNFQGDSYSLAGVTYQATEDGGGYFSPSLQEDMFQQVSVQDTMLLHGVDAAQLAETIQVSLHMPQNHVILSKCSNHFCSI